MTQPTHITDYLAKSALKYPRNTAIISEDRSLTWAELDELTNDMSAYLLTRIHTEDQQIVGILLPNSWQFIVAYLGILRAGHIALPLDPNFKKLETEAITEQVKPIITITNATYVAELPDGFTTIIIDRTVPKATPDNAGKALRLPAADQIASLLFTSGTTGKPKVTAYSHANHLWNISAVSKLWQWSHNDTILLSLPLSHWHGLVMGLAGALWHGNTIYLRERFDAADTVRHLESGDISLFMHVPTAYFKLVEYAGDRHFTIPEVRLCVSGSSYLPPAIWQGFKAAFNQEILERYGASETGLIASNTLEQRVPGRVGHILPGVTARIMPGGEIAMDSPGRFLGYYHNESATKEHTTPEGLWLTGDIGTFDDTGSLQLKGRVQEKIKRLGYTVYPRDVEWALLQNPGIHDVVAIGIQEVGALNDTMVYFAVSSLGEAEIRAFCAKNLPAAWRPDRVMLLDEIPKTRSGKPKLAQLRATCAR